MAENAAKTATPVGMRRVATASLVGTMVEWYDYFVFGTASAVVFNRVFFPDLDPAVGTLASFATLGVGFVARPLGAVVIGHFGDRVGRKSMLVLTLMVMGVATLLIGALPTYGAIGIWAPVLLVLLRLVQGFGVGGEWGGAVLMVVEHAPANRRGFWGRSRRSATRSGWSRPPGSSPRSRRCPRTSSSPGAGASPSSSAA
ncbi:MFS transporter [Streptomyces sp. M19]